MKNKIILIIFLILLVVGIIIINFYFLREKQEISEEPEEKEYEIFGFAGRQFTRYDDLPVESSIFKALNIENRTRKEVVVWINETYDGGEIEAIKMEILDILGEEFILTYDSKGSDLFSGLLTMKGIEKLKDSPYSIMVAEITIGTTMEDSFTYEEEISEEPEGKYYDWNVWFVIYKSTGRTVEFASDEEFESTKEEILSIIQPADYNESSYKITYQGIDNWYTGGEKTGKKNGFRIDITQKGYKNIVSKIKDIEYVPTIYFNIIIDSEIQKIPDTEEESTNCEFDRECIKIDSGCCGCSAGGAATTINRAYYDYWNDKSNCEGTSCTAVMSGHWTCFAKPKCINKKCKLVLNDELICNSIVYDFCIDSSEHFPDEEIESLIGIPCREVIEKCENLTHPIYFIFLS